MPRECLDFQSKVVKHNMIHVQLWTLNWTGLAWLLIDATYWSASRNYLAGGNNVLDNDPYPLSARLSIYQSRGNKRNDRRYKPDKTESSSYRCKSFLRAAQQYKSAIRLHTEDKREIMY